MEFRKMVTITLYARQQKRHRCIEQSFGLCGRGRGWDDLGEWNWNMYNIIYETSHQPRFDAWYWMLGAGALGQPRGMIWGGRREEGSGWRTCVYLWRIHFNIWQNQYNIVKLKNKIKKNYKNLLPNKAKVNIHTQNTSPNCVWDCREATAQWSQLLSPRDRLLGRQCFHGWAGGGDGFRMIDVCLVYSALYFCYYYIRATSDRQALDPMGWGPQLQGVRRWEA